MKRNFRKKAFTLVELVVATIIVAIIVAIIVPSYLTHLEEARGAKALETLHVIRTSEMLYLGEYGFYTATIADLQKYTPFSVNDGEWLYSVENIADGTFRVVAQRQNSNNAALNGLQITLDQDSLLEYNGVDAKVGGHWPP